MKLKSIMLLTLLSMLLGLAACGENSASAESASAPPGFKEINLVPYASDEFGISGTVPEEWEIENRHDSCVSSQTVTKKRLST
jgi:hypothetical protein